MRNIDLTNLPRKIYKGTNCIDWEKSTGETVHFIYDDISGFIEIIGHINSTKDFHSQKIKIKYNNKEFDIIVYNFINCKIGRIIGKISKDFKIEIGTEFNDNKRNMVIIDRFYKPSTTGQQVKYYVYNCNKCGYENGIISEWSIIKGNGCSCCYGFTVIEGINDIPTTATWMVQYFQGKYDEAKNYTCSSATRIYFKCPDCGKIKDKKIPIYNLYKEHSIGCSCKGNKSYPEKFMANVLTQLNVEYIWGYYPEWLKGYQGSKNKAAFDFYLPNYNLIIEMDGPIGHGKCIFKNSKTTINETKEKDNWKDIKAIENGLSVIRINADKSERDYLKQNIKDSLFPYFNFQIINWNKADELATKNILKDVCSCYEKMSIKSISDISSIFNLNRITVRKYLTKGNSIGWCSYTIENSIICRTEQLKASNIYRLSKRIAVYKDGLLLKEYDSATKCVQKSLLDFNQNFLLTGVCLSARTESKLYKGYDFKYINKIQIK